MRGCNSCPPLGFLVKKYKKAFLFIFLSICFDSCVLWTPFFHWRKDLGYTDLSDTEHVCQAHRNFPEAFSSKKTLLKTWGFVRIFQPDFEFHFSKYQLFSRLLRYNLIAEPCDDDFVAEGKISFEKVCTYLKMFAKATEKVLEVFEKSFSSKHEFCQNIPTWFLPNLNSLRFSWHIIWSVHCMVTICFTEQTRT